MSGPGLLNREMKALRILDLLEECCFQVDAYTYICLLHGCMKQELLSEGRIVHGHIVKTGFRCNMFLWTTIIDMYVQCSVIGDAKVVFDHMPDNNLASCNVMLAGYVKHGYAGKATEILNYMLKDGMKPDNVTVMTMIQACSVTNDIDGGRFLHFHALHENFKLNILFENALIDMYAKCGSLDDSHSTFRGMSKHDAVSWNTMIYAFASFGHTETSLQLFQDMHGKGVQPDDVTFLSVLNVCADLGSLDKGMETHLLLSKRGLDRFVEMENALIDLYGKCADVESAFQVFRSLLKGDGVSQNSLISGYAQSGKEEKVFELCFQEEDELKVDVVAMIGLLSACSHTGLVDFGCHLFQHITKACSSLILEDHHICMIDLYGRAGFLEEAFAYVETMPCQPQPSAWRAFLGACRIHNDVAKAREALKAAIESEPENDAARILFYNTYIASKRNELSMWVA